MHRALLGALIVFNVAGASYLIVDRLGDTEQAAAVQATSTTTPSSSATAATSTTTAPPPTTTAPPPTTTTAPPVVDRSQVFRGLGAWVDVFDFSPAYMQEGEPTPIVTPAHMDFLASVGVRTLYLQASRDDERTPGILESPRLLEQFLVRAHENDISVVAWYLPKKYDEGDLRRLQAIRDFRAGDHRFDGIGLDIEFRGDVPDVAERNARLVELSRQLRAEMGELPLAAIVLPPVVTDVINLDFWPAFPWQEIAPFYDAWMPMAYWTNRTSASGWRDAYRYTEANVNMVRERIGDPGALVHPIGGIGDEATLDDYRGFIEASHATNSIGASIYDFRTTAQEAWQVLIGSPG